MSENGILVGDDAGSTNFLTCAGEADCGPPKITKGACSVNGACHCTDDLAGVLGSEVCYRVDYSGITVPSLNEFVPNPGVGGLDENVGISGPSTNVDLVLYWAPGPSQLIGASNGTAIDWNNNGSIGTHAQADINNDGSYTLLTTQNDWELSNKVFKNLTLPFQCTMGYGAMGTPWHFVASEMRSDAPHTGFSRRIP